MIGSVQTEAVIFDFDGLLMDTEDRYAQLAAAVGERFDRALSHSRRGRLPRAVARSARPRRRDALMDPCRTYSS